MPHITPPAAWGGAWPAAAASPAQPVPRGQTTPARRLRRPACSAKAKRSDWHLAPCSRRKASLPAAALLSSPPRAQLLPAAQARRTAGYPASSAPGLRQGSTPRLDQQWKSKHSTAQHSTAAPGEHRQTHTRCCPALLYGIPGWARRSQRPAAHIPRMPMNCTAGWPADLCRTRGRAGSPQGRLGAPPSAAPGTEHPPPSAARAQTPTLTRGPEGRVGSQLALASDHAETCAQRARRPSTWVAAGSRPCPSPPRPAPRIAPAPPGLRPAQRRRSAVACARCPAAGGQTCCCQGCRQRGAAAPPTASRGPGSARMAGAPSRSGAGAGAQGAAPRCRCAASICSHESPPWRGTRRGPRSCSRALGPLACTCRRGSGERGAAA